MESRGQIGRLGSQWEEGEPGRGARVGVACRGAPCGRWGGARPRPRGPGPAQPQPRGGRVRSYQVTAGFARFSLARPQPIRAQRRCSRAGGLETRAPSPDTGSARRHTIAVRAHAHTHTRCPRHAAEPPHAITVTHSDKYTVPETQKHTASH